MLDVVSDENVQIHGGNGFVRDYPAERHYRDARVNRIFEGTNEINRLLVAGRLVGRTLREGAAGNVAPMDRASLPAQFDESQAVEAFKALTRQVVDAAMRTYGPRLADEQEVLLRIADLLIDIYASESAVLRARAAAMAQLPRAPLHVGLARLYVYGAAMRVVASARDALAAMLDAGGFEAQAGPLVYLVRMPPLDAVRLRRSVADTAIAHGGYPVR
jgi:alkylation response protein AidB-like acyl-CoA dehydrogenase